MSQPFVGEIRLFGGNFAPAGWAFCNGQLLAISQNDVLFNLIGTTYGGDGQNTFGLPDLQGRVPVHMGTNPTSGINYVIGQKAGVESVTLTTQQIPSHTHPVLTASASQGGPASVPSSATILADEVLNPTPNPAPFAYVPFSNVNQTALVGNSVGNTGGSQPHDNMQPFLAVSFIISLFGVFPSQN
jgi:microcystin-dependent protein